MRKFCSAIMLVILCLIQVSIMAQNVMPERSVAAQQQLDDVAHTVRNLEDASLSAAKSAQAMASTNMRVGFVNFRRVMSSIPQLAKLRDDLQREFRAQQQSLELLQAELSDLEQKINSNSNNSEVDALTQQLITKRRELARQQAAFQDDYNVRRNEELAKLQNLVLEEIVALAKAQNFDVILNDNGVLFVSQDADLTQLVIERFFMRTQRSPAN